MDFILEVAIKLSLLSFKDTVSPSKKKKRHYYIIFASIMTDAKILEFAHFFGHENNHMSINKG